MKDHTRIKMIRKEAKRRNVSYDLWRWFHFRMKDGNPELLEIQSQGFRAEAICWLKSATDKGMQCGTASREKRIEKAKEFAEKAGVDLSVLAEAEELGLEHVLFQPGNKV